MKSSMRNDELNLISKIIWLMINILFGTFLSNILFIWTACNMHLPLFLINLIPSLFKSFFNIPWINLELSLFNKIIFNALLCFIFGFVHTYFAQEKIQNSMNQLFPKSTLRTVYILLVSITSWLIIGLWQHTQIQLWDFLKNLMLTENQRDIILTIIFILILIPGLYVPFKFNIFEFLGIKQLLYSSNLTSTKCPLSMTNVQRTTGSSQLITTGLFQLCRHPLYLFTFLAIIVSPTVSFDRLLFVIYLCVYVSIGIPIEEKKLIMIFGEAYVEYRKTIPAIIPNLFSFGTRKSKTI
ncbi:unnamed protein product [Didymodactylos carnosus]|uniref:Nuclear envelope membrane protein n=1 Tax=Didymodactylos carnosus TaxID=1234261 RepID=A0A813ZY43_9BILA|nr:unnamed protein product [Didymodactylos carnosus]CAF3688121.1 unnamed protein product [Didymodactylos carnosus]